MAGLTNEEKQLIEQRLYSEKNELEHILDNDRKEESIRDSTGELSSYDNHPADIATEAFERGRDQAVDENIQQQLADVKQAIGRFETDTYGKCEVCGEPIPFERLEAIPWASTCVEHSEVRESGDTAAEVQRPIEEEVLEPILASPNDDDRGQAEIDDTDAWRTVKNYGNSSDTQETGNSRPKTNEDPCE
ncbi:TraR/DksA C4-type zinc finger protein [Paenibacillus lutrae]|uniref:Sporulation protein, yteA family n=1 Tax=Paenibacillus lutrae TaxID=2078573 RepID=A0A7X3FHS2_9BACL|nr:TraR/DksA C4-type zinc finger protein [Paenibacillus lutrae]MVO99892.1 sporulation protein, yteA family [Paenibacillus lutrae]